MYMGVRGRDETYAGKRGAVRGRTGSACSDQAVAGAGPEHAEGVSRREESGERAFESAVACVRAMLARVDYAVEARLVGRHGERRRASEKPEM